MWNPIKIISKGKYNYVLLPEHPNATKHGYVLEHRVIVENNIGRLLKKNEFVHHINGKTKDNRFENLSIVLDSEHAKNHMYAQGMRMVRLKCPECGVFFERRKGNTYLQKGGTFTACSRKCRAIFSRKIQLFGITSEITKAFAENIASTFIQFTLDEFEKPKISCARSVTDHATDF